MSNTATDTIVAPATVPGTGAISIIRVSGPDCFRFADAVIQLKRGSISECDGYTIHYGEVSNLDDVLVSVFRAPHSYTGEDSVEISFHASRYIADELVRRLLSVTPAPVIISDSSPVLSDTIVAEDGETHLSMVDRILSAINWRLRISGDGTIYVLPYSTDPAAVFDPIGNDLIEPKIKVSQDWYNCPNVYMAVAGDVTGIARDEDPESMFSVANRGREVWKRETGCALAANETVAEYALRKLKEAQHAKQKASYSRRFVPDVYPEDCVSMRYHAQGLDGIYTVSSQSITLGYGARTSEQIYKE